MSVTIVKRFNDKSVNLLLSAVVVSGARSQSFFREASGRASRDRKIVKVGMTKQKKISAIRAHMAKVTDVAVADMEKLLDAQFAKSLSVRCERASLPVPEYSVNWTQTIAAGTGASLTIDPLDTADVVIAKELAAETLLHITTVAAKSGSSKMRKIVR